MFGFPPKKLTIALFAYIVFADPVANLVIYNFYLIYMLRNLSRYSLV